MKESRLSQEELDIISDNLNKYEEREPTRISKQEIKESEAEDFLVLLHMYGSIIKNAELLDNKYKTEGKLTDDLKQEVDEEEIEQIK